MTHKMGLIGVVMTPHDVYNTLYYDGNTYTDDNGKPKWTVNTTKSSTTKVVWNGSTSFTGTDTHRPFVSGATCYQIVTSSSTPSYSTTTDETNKKYAWSQSCTAITTAGKYEGYSVDYNVDFINACWEFSYSGTGQTWVVPIAGTYKFECWGGSGGNADFKSGSLVGRGGFVSGEIDLSNETMYVYVGGYGIRTLKYEGFVGYGGYNGGGTASNTGCGGGGATDVRLVVDDFKSRIIVAGGGGGENNYNVPGSAYTGSTGNQGSKGGDAGGLRGLIFYARTGGNLGSSSNYGGSQTAGGTAAATAGVKGDNGSFGIGGKGYYGAGGGGWYGGSGGSNCPSAGGGEIGGGGGSSFISGYTGCRAVNSSTGAVLSDNYMTINGKQYIFSSMSMIDGGSTMRKPDDSGNETGHIGNGFCRITFIPN